MRIPVTKTDLDGHRFSKISRALQKFWPNGRLGYLQAQSLLAELLGYRNLHQLQQEAPASAPESPSGSWSRQRILHCVAWNAFRGQRLGWNDAVELATRLHLDELEIDALTLEARWDAATLALLEHDDSTSIFVDEAWDLMHPDWHEKTPELLASGVPAYAFAVLPDQRVFQWKRLTRLVDSLPTDYLQRLRGEDLYAELPDDASVQRRFVQSDLLPAACTSVVDAARHDGILPREFALLWLFRRDGQCLGKAWHNQALDGLIPVVYEFGDNDRPYRDVARILCGSVVAGDTAAEAGDWESIYVLAPWQRYEWEKGVKDGRVTPATVPDVSKLVALPGRFRISGGEGVRHLIGAHFNVAGQRYVRMQQWIRVENLPTWFLRPASGDDVSEASAGGFAATESAIPTAALALHGMVRDQFMRNAKEAAARLHSPAGLAELLDLMRKAIDVRSFEAWCSDYIESELPPANLGDVFGLEAEMDRRRELAAIDQHGDAIRRVLPELELLSRSSLGLMLLKSQGHSPDSRYRWSVRRPARERIETQAEIAGYLVLAGVALRAGVSPASPADTDLLGYALTRVLKGECLLSQLPAEYDVLVSLRDRFQQQQQMLDRMHSWLAHNDEMREERARGEFLYVGESISPVRPKSLADLMQDGRRYSGFVVTQTLADFEKRLEVASHVELPRNS